MNQVVKGLKRSYEEVRESDVSLFGEISGVLHLDLTRRIDCGMVCGGWPTFAFAAVARGWNIKFICLKNNEWSAYFPLWFRTSIIIDIDAFANPAIIQQGVTIWFSDIDPPRCLSLWDSDATMIVSLRRARHIRSSNWAMTPLHLNHVSCGGVTDGSWTVSVYHKKDSASFTLAVHPVSGRNLHSLLDAMASGRPCVAPPKVTPGSTPVVIKQRQSTYHCDGLLPWSNRQAFITAPSVFSPTKWVRRKLTTQEMLNVLDVPDSLGSSLTPRQQTSLIHDDNLLPLKVALQLLNGLPISILARPIEQPATTKRSCLTLTTGLEPPVLPSEPLQLPVCTTDVSISTTPVDEHQFVEELRTQKATKSDDAPVPEYLWDRAIVQDDDPNRQSIITSLGTLRVFALRWWKRHLTREFCIWFRGTHSSNLTSFAAK